MGYKYKYKTGYKYKTSYKYHHFRLRSYLWQDLENNHINRCEKALLKAHAIIMSLIMRSLLFSTDRICPRIALYDYSRLVAHFYANSIFSPVMRGKWLKFCEIRNF